MTYLRGYYVVWHPVYGMCMTARNVPGDVPTLEHCKRPELGMRFAEDATKVMYLAEDGRVWMLKEATPAGFEPAFSP